MSDKYEKSLQKIKVLQRELKEREDEVHYFRSELNNANNTVESVLSEMQNQMDVLQKIQSYLIPTNLPLIQGFSFSSKYIASHKSGGDYFDVYSGGDKFNFSIVLASSSGHMVSALVMSVMLRYIGENIKTSSSLVDTIEAIVTQLKDQFDGGDQVDLFFANVNKKNYELNYALFGEIYIFHVKISSGEVELIDSSYSSIHSKSDSPVKLKTLSLAAKEKVIICSKGLLKEGSGGIEFLYSLISKNKSLDIHELRNEILFNMVGNNKDHERDITLLVVEVGENVIKLAK